MELLPGSQERGPSKEENLPVEIRWMIRRDMPEILQIEQASFDQSWAEEHFLQCLRQRNCIGMVAESNNQTVGFMIYELHKRAVHLLNFAVHPEYRRQQVGTCMIEKLKSKLSAHRRTRITLNMPERFLSAQLFFKKQGFRAVRVLRNFFEDPSEDAYFMRYDIPQEPYEGEDDSGDEEDDDTED